jgi:hypothetical protein
MDLATQRLMSGAAGAGGDGEFIDDFFSITVRQGTSSTKQITNGIDFQGEGGLVITKVRAATGGPTENWTWVDTERGTGELLESDTDAAEQTDTSGSLSSFNNNGYTIPSGQRSNYSTGTYVDYCFRKMPGFFDIVTYAGNDTAGRQISHNLGSVPGLILVKKTTGTSDWQVYHRSLGATKFLLLNEPNAVGTNSNRWNDTEPTATHFTLGSTHVVNNNGDSYVAYLFAHDEQSFGVKGNNSVIKCGSYTGNGNSNGPEINLGFEPEWLLLKSAGTVGSENWRLYDSLRGVTVEGNDKAILPSTAHFELSYSNRINFTSTGFKITTSNTAINRNNDTIAYCAIRRPDGYVGKPVDAGTDVFAMDTGNGSSTIPAFDSGFNVDWAFMKEPASTGDWYAFSRLSVTRQLVLNTDGQEGGASNYTFDSNSGFSKGSDTSDWQAWMWKRHAGFDVVCYEGTGSNQAINHSLGKKVEMAWIKRRDGAADWKVYHSGTDASNPEDYNLTLNGSGARDYSTSRFAAPTSTQFTVKTHATTNGSGNEYIMMLFASVSGVSKLGSYTGNATDSDPTSGTNTITFGFQPRMVIVKSYDINGEWVILDTLRGWTTGDNTKRLRLNLTNQQTTEPYGYPTSTGMVLTGNGDGLLNSNTKNYIYYAHA